MFETMDKTEFSNIITVTGKNLLQDSKLSSIKRIGRQTCFLQTFPLKERIRKDVVKALPLKEYPVTIRL